MNLQPVQNETPTAHITHLELLNRFVEFIDAQPKTIETYSRAIKQFFRYLSEHSITQPTRSDIMAYRDYLKNTHKATTVQSYLIALKQFFKWSAAEGIYANVAENIKGAKVEKSHKKDALTSKQAREVLQGIDTATIAGKRDFAILSLMLTGGLRTVEVVRADITDIRTVGDHTVLFIQGKGRDEKNEYVKLAEPVEAAIRAYLKARGKVEQGAPLFSSTSNNNQGERMTTRSISAIVKAHLVRAGYDSDRVTAHSLRHTAATLNLLNGATIEETQQLLRHSNINTTMIYAHHLDRAKNQSENRIAAAIF